MSSVICSTHLSHLELACGATNPQIHRIKLPLSGNTVFYTKIDDDNNKTVPQALQHFRRQHQPETSWGILSLSQVELSLAFFDMDGTLIAQETSVELAERFLSKQLKDEVERITTQSMAGEISFVSNLIAKMKLFENTQLSMLNEVTQSCTLNTGAEELITHLHNNHIQTYLVTGGLKSIAASYAKKLRMAGFCANTERWVNRSSDLHQPDWIMTGELEPPIIDSAAKARYLSTICKQQNINPSQCMIVGDGANDIAMAKLSGLAIGFHPKAALTPHLHIANETANHLFALDLINHVRSLHHLPLLS